MAYLRVNIPDGDYCNGCIFNQSGTVVCELFGFLNEVEILVDEREVYRLAKHESCKEHAERG